LERYSGGAKTCNFWTTVKPFFSKKCNSGEQKIILCENNKIINDAKDKVWKNTVFIDKFINDDNC
jgi:hypothetical protein